jgi:hypothetical protein
MSGALSRGWITGVGAIIGTVLFVSPCLARWESPKRVIHSTAHTLEDGEAIIGIFSPLAYGATNSLTIMTHPISMMLVTPNLVLRLRIFDSLLATVAWSLDGAWSLEDLKDSDLPGPFETTQQKGHWGSDFVVTFMLAKRFTLTASAGYRQDTTREEIDSSLRHNIRFGGSAMWLISRDWFVSFRLGSAYVLSQGLQKASEWAPINGTVLVAHAWETLRIGFGWAIGDHPLVTRNKTVTAPGWIVLDAWWRF